MKKTLRDKIGLVIEGRSSDWEHFLAIVTAYIFYGTQIIFVVVVSVVGLREHKRLL